MSELLNSIGKRIKALRKNHRLTQKEFASSVNISQGNLSEMEQDKISPSYDTLISIVTHYKVSADWILMGKKIYVPAAFPESPEIKKMHDVIEKLMHHPDPEIRTWAKIQFQKAFGEYMSDEEKGANARH